MLLDQLPVLADLQRYLEHLSMMDPPAIKQDFILEQVIRIWSIADTQSGLQYFTWSWDERNESVYPVKLLLLIETVISKGYLDDDK